MIRLDSINLEANIDCIKDFPFSAAQRKSIEIGGNIVSKKQVFLPDIFGVKNIVVDEIAGKVLIDLSAKVLRQDYKEGININTIDQLCSALNSTPTLKIDANTLIDTAILHRADINQNLKTEGNIDTYLSVLAAMPINDKYKQDYKDKPNNKGVTIWGKQKTFTERIIYYDKQVEISQRKAKGHFIKAGIDFVKLHKDFAGVLRVENNIQQHRKIRELCNVPDTKLLSVLNSTANPNLTIYDKVMSRVPQVDLSLWNEDPDLHLFELERLIGRRDIIRRCNNDMSTIVKFLKSRYSAGSNIQKQIKIYRTELAAMYKLEGRKQPIDYLNELRQMIAAA